MAFWSWNIGVLVFKSWNLDVVVFKSWNLDIMALSPQRIYPDISVPWPYGLCFSMTRFYGDAVVYIPPRPHFR